MKKILTIATALLMMNVAFAKDIKTVVLKPTPQMHCQNCENKIKNNLRFVKGVKSIDTSLEKQTVTVVYDADKTDVKKIQESLRKAKYETKVQK